MSRNTQVDGWLNQLRSLSASEWCHDISDHELRHADVLAEEVCVSIGVIKVIMSSSLDTAPLDIFASSRPSLPSAKGIQATPCSCTFVA
jgi:hypothetical protein